MLLLALAAAAVTATHASSCSVNGHDLSGLSGKNVVVDAVSGFQYTFNACGTIECDMDDCSVCQTFYPSGDNSKCAGLLSTQQVSMDGAGVKFAYTGGTDHRMSTIQFNCNTTANGFSDGTVTNTGASYAISGNDNDACINASPTPTPMPPSSSCSVNGHDLSGLSGKNVVVDAVSGFQYTFNACGTIECDMDDCSVCQTFYPSGDNSKCAGLLSTQQVSMDGAGVKFAYTGGTDHRMSTIQFNCNTTANGFSDGTVTNTGASYAISGNDNDACLSMGTVTTIVAK